MFSLFDKFTVYMFFNICVSLNALVELPKFEFSDLITTEQIIKNSTNSVLSSLKLVKPVNFTRVRDYATTLRHFLSLTFRDSEILNDIARLTRVDKTNNKTEVNLTTILNELLDESSFEFTTSDVGMDESDDSISIYINSFLAKLEDLKENFGVNKVFSDINANIIKIFRRTNETFTEDNEFVNLSNGGGESFDIFGSNEFWKSGRRIFKGKRTKIKYFPFMASVQMFNSFQCAGSIIKSDLVITASSCLQLAWNNRLYRENPAFLSVRVGSSFYNNGGENIPVLEIYFHPEYNPQNLQNNICLMRLVRHLKFQQSDKRRIRKISIDKQASNLPINIPGITILGWGAKGESGRLTNPWVNILSYAVLDVYPLRECQEIFTKEYVTNKNFCGGFFSKGAGACNRDIGGPGVVNGLLMGVVSFGSPICGNPDVPTVFTKLGYYYNWIENIMDMELPRGLRGSTLENLRYPYDAYMTTPYTTTFKMKLIRPDSKPEELVEDEETLLRNLDDSLFQEFLRTMFREDKTQKYQYLIDQVKNKQSVAEMKTPYTEIKEIGRENVGEDFRGNEEIKESQIFKPVINKEHAIAETYQTVTPGYDSENYLYPSTVQDYNIEDYIPTTALVFTDNSKVASQLGLYYETPATEIKLGQLETYFETPATKITRGQPTLYYETKFIPIKQHSKDIGRNVDISVDAPIQNTEEVATTKLPAQIELEMNGSSDDESGDSDQLLSDDKDKYPAIKEVVKEPQTKNVNNISGEQNFTKLLHEIDLDQIINEISMDNKDLEPENNSMPKSESPINVLVTFPTNLAAKERIVKHEGQIYENIGREGKNINESVLTLLYLSETEKKNNFHMDSRNFGHHTKNNLVHQFTPHYLASSESIYKAVPKSNIYKIMRNVLNEAMYNKKED